MQFKGKIVMKKIIAFLLSILLLLGLAGCQKATNEGYKLFRSTPLGFSIEYPDFWQKNSDNKEGIAVFVTPTEGYSDQHSESLSVQRFTPDMAYTDYIRGYVADLESSVANYKLVSEKETTLAGKKAYQIVYESTSEDGKNALRFMQTFAEHKEKIYVLTYIGEFESDTYFLKDVETMIATFRFLK